MLTHTFVPLLLKSQDPRLIFMASGTSSLAGTDNPKLPVNKSVGPGWPKKPEDLKVVATSYRSAKAGLNMLMR